MRKKNSGNILATSIAGVFVLCSSSLVSAGSVNDVNMTSFAPATAAVAAEVNGNFNELKTQVNDNDGRLVALEAQIAALTGGSITAASMNGVYKFVSISSGGQGNSSNYALSTVGREKGDISFDGNGSCTSVATASNWIEIHTDLDASAGTFGLLTMDSTMTEDTQLEPQEACTYTITAAGELSVTYALGGTDIFHMSPGLNFGAGAFRDTEPVGGGATAVDAILAVLVKKTPTGP